jgi:beta-barrel assembly-enhancing protease
MRALKVLLVTLTLALSSCSVLNSARNGNVVGALGSAANQAARAAEKANECSKLSQAEVGWVEENSIGGAVALGLAGKVPLFVDLGAFDPKTLTLSADGNATAPAKLDVVAGARADLGAYLNRVGRYVASYSSRPTITWTFAVIDDSTVNAFSAPGGYVFVTTGLLKSLQNEDQLASVLAHEVAHITQRHALNLYRDSKVSTCKWAIPLEMAVDEGTQAANRASGGATGAALRFADVLSGGAFNPNALTAEAIEKLTDAIVDGLHDNGLDQSLEYEADAVATDLVTFAGYDGREYAKLLDGLSDAAPAAKHHPAGAARASKVTERLASADLAPFVNTKARPRPIGPEVTKANISK